MRVSLIYIGILVGALALVIGFTMLAMRVARWRRDQALRRHGVPPLVMPLTEESGSAPRPVAWHDRPPSAASLPSVGRAPEPSGADILPDEARLPDDDSAPVDTGPFRPGAVRPGLPSAHLVAGSQVRFFRAEEGTLEFLPGHLEIVGGDDVGQEIHFARQVGEEGAVVTFGRSEGPPLRHIQLLDPTVSRQHARMNWERGRWYLANLSTTNAVVHNGRNLEAPDDPVALEDGDRIEMGAVVFVFHGR